jgi:hypothetical protein
MSVPHITVEKRGGDPVGGSMQGVVLRRRTVASTC